MKKSPLQISRARELRTNQTDAENLIWYYLRDRRLANHKFKRQVPIGKYIVDFVCDHKGLIVELDGGQHADNVRYDFIRTQFLESKGYKVIRFWNNEVLAQSDRVLEVIMKELGAL